MDKHVGRPDSSRFSVSPRLLLPFGHTTNGRFRHVLGSYFPPSSFGRKVKEENRKIVRVSICSITKILFLGALPSGSEPTQLGKAKSRDPSLLQSQHQLENER